VTIVTQTVHSAESVLRRPGQLASLMVRDLWSARELGWRLFLRDFNAQYRQTLLGFVWAFLPPLMTTGMFLFLNRANVLKSDTLPVSMPLYIFVGMLYWQLFLDCLQNPLKVVESARNLITKVDFPRESLVIAALGQSLVTFAVRLLLLIVFCAFGHFIPPIWAIPLAIAAAVPAMLFGLCLGLLAVPPGLLFKDLGQAMTLGTMFLLVVTPVGYFVNAASPGHWYYRLNPLLYLINLPRDLFFGITTPYAPLVGFLFLGSLALLITGWVIFRISVPIIFERLGA